MTPSTPPAPASEAADRYVSFYFCERDDTYHIRRGADLEAQRKKLERELGAAVGLAALLPYPEWSVPAIKKTLREFVLEGNRLRSAPEVRAFLHWQSTTARPAAATNEEDAERRRDTGPERPWSDRPAQAQATGGGRSRQATGGGRSPQATSGSRSHERLFVLEPREGTVRYPGGGARINDDVGLHYVARALDMVATVIRMAVAEGYTQIGLAVVGGDWIARAVAGREPLEWEEFGWIQPDGRDVVFVPRWIRVDEQLEDAELEIIPLPYRSLQQGESDARDHRPPGHPLRGRLGPLQRERGGRGDHAAGVHPAAG